MNRKIKLSLTLGFVALSVLACAAVVLREPTEQDVQFLASRGETASLPDLQEGKLLLSSKCARCHGTPDSADGAEKDWPEVLTRMAKRSKLDSAQTWRIQAYMSTLQAKNKQ